MEQQLRRRVTWLAIAVGVLLALLLLVATLPRGGRSEPSLAVAPPTAAEAEVDSAAPATEPTAGGFSLGLGDAVSLAWRLGLVALVLGGAVVALRWWGRRLSAPTSQSGLLRIADTLPLGSGRTIHILEAGDRVYVIGATPHHVSLIGEVDRLHAAEALREGRSRATFPPFSQALQAALGRERRDDVAFEVRS
jgi:flagellar biogenesis protein FliO